MSDDSRKSWRRFVPERRRAQFSLGTLLALVTLFCVWLGLLVNRAHLQRDAVVALRSIGAHVTYDHELGRDPTDDPVEDDDEAPPRPWGLRDWLGVDMVRNVEAVEFSAADGVPEARFGDADAAHLRAFPRLKVLTLYGSEVTSRGLRCLEALPLLQELSLVGSCLNDPPEAQLAMERIGKCRSLKGLMLMGQHVTNTAVAEIAGLPKLRWLNLSYTAISDEGLKEIGKIKSLESLSVEDTRVTDAGLKELVGLMHLSSLYIGRTKVTESGMRELKSVNPNLTFWDWDCTLTVQ